MHQNTDYQLYASDFKSAERAIKPVISKIQQSIEKKKGLFQFVREESKKTRDDYMKFQLFKCEKCIIYTFKSICPQCGMDTKLSHPAKYSPDYKYARYRLAENYD